MELRLLGPLELVVGRQVLKIGGPRQRVVLSMLAVNANRVTSVHALVDVLWDTAPTSTARGQIQTCVSSLRKLISDAGSPCSIWTRAPGYVLEIAPTDLDSETFLAHVANAWTQAADGRLAAAAATLRTALALWRGPALADVDSELVRHRAAQYEDQRLAAIEERVRLDLANRTLDLLVDDDELARRREGWAPPAPRYTTGVLAKYAKLVGSAATGAICG